MPHSKRTEGDKKHLPSQWTPDSFAAGLDSNVAPLQREQSWRRQLRNCSGLWQVNLLYYISKPHTAQKEAIPSRACSLQTQLCQAWLAAGEDAEAEIAKCTFSVFGVQEFTLALSSSKCTSYWLWTWAAGHGAGMGINLSPKRALSHPPFQVHGSLLFPPESPPPSLQTSLLSLPTHLLEWSL